MANIEWIIVLSGLMFVFCWAQVYSLSTTPPMTGGWSSISTDDKAVKNFTNFAIDNFNQRSNAITIKGLVNILEAKSQVVAGIKYWIKFTIGDTNCKKNGNQLTNADNCQVINTNVRKDKPLENTNI
jgi:hypothetical protein